MTVPRRPLGVLIAVAVISALAAVTAGATSSKRQDVTIRLMSPNQYAVQIPALAAAFMQANPRITVNVELPSGPVAGPLYQTEFRAGAGPDVFYTEPGRGTLFGVMQYADAGFIKDISGRPWQKTIPQPFLVGRTSGKKLWAYAIGATTFAMFYNIDLFNQFGVKIPQTFAEVLAACRKISAAGKVPISWSPGDSSGNRLPFMTAAGPQYSKAPNWNVLRQAGKVTFANSAGWKRAWQQIVEMKNASCFSPGAVGTGAISALTQFANGSAAMTPASPATASQVLAINPNVNLGGFAFPSDKAEDTRDFLVPNVAFSANASLSGEKLAAALKLLDFLATPAQTKAFAQSALLLTSQDLLNGVIPSYFPQGLRPLGPILKRKNVIVPSFVWPNPQVGAAVANGCSGLLTGQLTIDQVLASMDDAFNRGRGGGK
jgi:raffinose/stachyose/melibiose transport system substrate-binding protein